VVNVLPAGQSGNPDAIDLTTRGWAILNQPQLYIDKDNLAKALDLLERALKLDPNNVDALVGAALVERNDFVFSGMGEKSGQLNEIEELLANAIKIDPTNARAYPVRGLLYLITKRKGRAYAQLAMDE
jgi:adenylate cyclase